MIKSSCALLDTRDKQFSQLLIKQINLFSLSHPLKSKDVTEYAYTIWIEQIKIEIGIGDTIFSWWTAVKELQTQV